MTDRKLSRAAVSRFPEFEVPPLDPRDTLEAIKRMPHSCQPAALRASPCAVCFAFHQTGPADPRWERDHPEIMEKIRWRT